MRFSVTATPEDPAERELREILTRFFSLKGYDLAPGMVVTVSAPFPPIDDPIVPLDQVQDLIQLHPDPSDEVQDEEFDIVNEVAEFETLGKFA